MPQCWENGERCTERRYFSLAPVAQFGGNHFPFGKRGPKFSEDIIVGFLHNFYINTNSGRTRNLTQTWAGKIRAVGKYFGTDAVRKYFRRFYVGPGRSWSEIVFRAGPIVIFWAGLSVIFQTGRFGLSVIFWSGLIVIFLGRVQWDFFGPGLLGFFWAGSSGIYWAGPIVIFWAGPLLLGQLLLVIIWT